MPIRFFKISGLLASIGILSGFTYSYDPAGHQLKLTGSRKLNMAGNYTNSSGLSADAFFKAVSRGLQRWQEVSRGTVSFDYWQGSEKSIYEPNSNYNGVSSVYFASNFDEGSAPVVAGLIGLTQVWYNTSSEKFSKPTSF